MSRRMRLRASFGFIALALVAAVSASILSIGQPVHASPADAVIKKAIGYGIAQCYKQGAMVSPITAESYNDNWGPSSIVSYGGGSYAMPTGAYNGVYSLSCAELLNGNGVNGAFPGAYSIAGVTPPENASNTSAFESFMTSMGYTKHNADGGGRCASFTYASGSDTDVTKLCAETDSQGHITGGVTYQGSGLVFRIDVTDTQVKPICTQLFDSFATNSCSAISYTKNSTDFEWLAGQVLSQLIAHRANGFLGGSYKLVEKVDFESRGNALAEYRIDNKTTAGNRALKTLTGYANENATKLTPPEQQSLLQDYLLNYYGVQNYGCDLSSDQQGVASSAGYAKIETSMFGGTLQTCWIRPTKNQNSSVAAFNSQGFFDGTSMDYDAVVKALGGSVNDMKAADKKKCNDAANTDLSNAMTIVDQYIMNPNSVSKEDSDRAQKTIDEINKIKQDHGAYWHEENGTIVCYTYTKLDGTTSDTPTDSTNPPDAPTEDPEDPGEAGVLDGCFSNAGVLGWILCPVLRMAGAATEGIYDMIVQNYLSVKSETITSEALRGSWSTFQGYANILFAILLIVVILSQVTGIGLSNYGIKKVLPKLIITIILVNLSYILCAIMVDLSNIVGTSLNDLLSGMDAGGFVADEVNIGTMVINSVEGIGLTALAIGAGGATIPILAESWPNLILVLFLAVISILISILFFFILLVVRQAAIIILIVIAPLAVVCYALPNTQKLFDRWFKAFSALLMVFPICGAVMGGCNYASRLLLSAGGNNGLLYYIIVMVLGVVPLFFIPSILKSSMSALGNAGRMLATAGDRFSRWTNRAIVGSQLYQDRKQEAQRTVNMNRNRRIAKRNKDILDPLQAKLDAGGTLTAAERRQYNRATYRRARALSGNRRIYNEDNQAAAMAQGEDYADFAADDPRRLAAIQQYRGRDTEDLSRGYSTMWKNDGTAGSTTKQQVELDAALAALEKDAENQDAQARFRAITRMMSTSDKGRAALEQSINKRIKALGEAGTDTNKGLQWAANEAMEGPRGGEFKKIAPSLFNTLSRVADGGAGNEYSKMATWTDGSGVVHKNFDADGSLTADADESLYSDAIDRMSAAALPEIDDRDFDRYIGGLRNGKITGTAKAKLISSAVEALNDPRIKLKPKTAAKVHEIANMSYTQHTENSGPTGHDDLHGSDFTKIDRRDAEALTAAGSGELDRIAEGFRNGTIAQDGPGANEKSDMLNVIQRALEEARLNGGMVGSVELSGSNASKMLKILKDNGRTLVDAGGATLRDSDYGSLMRIRHSRASYSPNWRQATAADVITTPSLHVGDWIDTSGSHPRLLNAQELKEVKAVDEFNVRQKVKESADNGTSTP